jgi:hypothetical protein
VRRRLWRDDLTALVRALFGTALTLLIAADLQAVFVGAGPPENVRRLAERVLANLGR